MYIYIISNILSQFTVPRRSDETINTLLTCAYHCRRDQLKVGNLGALSIYKQEVV